MNAPADAASDIRQDDTPEDVYVVFTPSGRRGFVPPETTVLDAARSLGVDLDSVCGGRSMCGRCQIQLSEGEFAKFQITSRASSISETTKSEQRYAEKRGLKPGRRLGCNAKVLANCVIDIPPESQVHRQVVRKRAEVRDIEIRPVTHLHYVDVREPDLHDQSSDFRRLCESLREQWPNWGIADDVSCDYAVMTSLQKALRDGAWKVTVALRGNDRVVGVWPGFREKIYGLAVDIGSTTMSGHLCDLATGKVLSSAGTMNPQIRFGEDLMSRVSYVMMNPGGDEEMTRVVREAVNYLATQTAAEIGAGSDEIVDLVFVGNPVMHHLMLGIDPTELGGAPFALTVDTAVELTAAEMDLYLHPGARVYALPCIAGHVGADTAAVVLSETPYKRDEVTLIVDVGTNAEIVLGNRDRLLACSSPTGPAFEGAQISSGQRAAPGAIERVRIDPETLEPRFQIIGTDRWSDEDGFEETVAELGISGVCGSGIIEAIGEMFLAGMITTDGMIDGALAAKSDRVFPDGRTFSYRISDTVSVTQGDVRAIQLAKAALYAGSRLLMDRLGVDSVDRVVLAGAFGSHIDPKYAMVLGMIPDCELENVVSVGNAAGTGARIALLNGQARKEIEWVVRTIEKVETAVEPRFQEHFVGAMALPHKTDPYPKLSAAVKMPAPRVAVKSGEEGGRRRRRRG
ncbi:ASKHA domain-containing protein [Nisaea nitritireducens]|uniref:ASKHA domain-containing protein n=1 Tax=Nisaea nitritireducens TaxID=568392 RepID=UPI0018676EC2|nr:ASKHA domain-containing protein [Nisaea nitritireducens]